MKLTVRDKSISYMQVACGLGKEIYMIVTCYNCPDKGDCEAYTLIMDLTAERNVCPLDPIMEKCVVDGEYLPHIKTPKRTMCSSCGTSIPLVTGQYLCLDCRRRFLK